MHDMPRFITRNGNNFKNEFVGTNGLTFDLFDICVRRIQQLDMSMLHGDIPLRWRHIFESDFAVSLLVSSGGCIYFTDKWDLQDLCPLKSHKFFYLFSSMLLPMKNQSTAYRSGSNLSANQ